MSGLGSLTDDVHRWLARQSESVDRSTELVGSMLRQIDEGIQLRRQMDAIGEAMSIARRDLIRRLAIDQYRALDLLGRSAERVSDPMSATAKELAGLLDEWTRRDDVYASDLLSQLDVATGAGLALADSFYSDLQWYTLLTSHLTGEAEPDRAYAIKSRLDRLQSWLSDAEEMEGATEEARRALEECRALERDYLDLRIRDEIAFPIEGDSVLSLWNRRWQLSRLEADRLAAADKNGRPGATGRLEQLEAKQRELADRVDARLKAMSDEERRKACRELLHAAEEESNDVLTLVEDVELPVAVELLRSSTSDFRRLSASLREHGRGEGRLAETIRKHVRRSRNELQEKQLAVRMENLIGRRAVAWIENVVLVLILAMTVLIVWELVLSARGVLTSSWVAFFAWADLAICSLFLSEFLFKLILAPDRVRYLRRHFLVDFLASIPFGFLTYQAGVLATMGADQTPLLRLLRFLRLPQLARYARVVQPVVRVLRLVLFLLRTTDRIVRRHAAVFNRNIVLFEPDALGMEEPAYRLRLARLRDHFQLRLSEIESITPARERAARVDRSVGELRLRLESLPTTAAPEPARRTSFGRDVHAEEVVRELVEMTPERLVQRMGPGFPESVSRYVRFFDLPLVRLLPFVRELVAVRSRGAGEVASLAANQLGYALQAILDVGYFFADLQGTISGPIFLDRLGTLLVNATARNARRLMMFSVGMFLLWGSFWFLHLSFLQWAMNRISGVVEGILILGLVCFAVMLVGQWLKRIANQSSEAGERLVEAQFAAQTKALKVRHRRQDIEFLAQRVVGPELFLRTLDDPEVESNKLRGVAAQQILERAVETALPDAEAVDEPLDAVLADEELVFLRNVALLHRDFQDAGLFRPTDTKTTTQLLGNLALANLRQTNVGRLARENRRLQALDLTRSATLFGGPYLWFNYMTRIVTEETAKLIRDYNRHAIPLPRLASAPHAIRENYRSWLASRLGVKPEAVVLPASVAPPQVAEVVSRDVGAAGIETIDFTAMDFLTDDPDRESDLEQKYGAGVVRLLRSDRRRAIRRAFRSFPLHHFPESQRTLNAFSLYLDYVSGGRVFLIPMWMAWGLVKGVAFFFQQVSRTIRDILNPRVAADTSVDQETFSIALRKIHRMRKPSFMASLWLRARVDIEYLGIPLPEVGLTVASNSLLDDDLNFVGATRRERLAAEQLVLDQRRRLDRWLPTLERLGWKVDRFPAYLRERYLFLANRSAEVTRAMATAWVVDADGVYSLATSLDGLTQMTDWARSTEKGAAVPATLPESLLPVRPRSSTWLPSARRTLTRAFDRMGVTFESPSERRRVIGRLARRWALVRDWALLLADLPGEAPVKEVLLAKWRDVILRTDLWSDQMVVLRTLQSLSVLDVFHYCRVVWTLGGFGEREGVTLPTQLPMRPGAARVTIP